MTLRQTTKICRSHVAPNATATANTPICLTPWPDGVGVAGGQDVDVEHEGGAVLRTVAAPAVVQDGLRVPRPHLRATAAWK